MAILARLLMLAACVPLLLPPGMCVCMPGPGDSTPPAAQGHATAAGEETAARSRSGCCSNPQCVGDHGRAGPSAGELATGSGSVPLDDAPASDCPTSPEAGRHKWVEPAQTLLALALPPALTAIVEPAATAGVVRHPAVASSAWPSAPPLYLSHCSLVI